VASEHDESLTCRPLHHARRSRHHRLNQHLRKKKKQSKTNTSVSILKEKKKQQQTRTSTKKKNTKKKKIILQNPYQLDFGRHSQSPPLDEAGVHVPLPQWRSGKWIGDAGVRTPLQQTRHYAPNFLQEEDA
jgi:hypothetical protein